jgi:hypothetical protein
VRGSTKVGAIFAPGVSLKNLDTRPAVIKARQFLRLDHQHEIYGDDGKLETIKQFHPNKYLRLLPKPADIYMVGMAAGSYSAGEKYTAWDIKYSITLATKAFLNTMHAQYRDKQPIKIHTGQWGAGVFNNSRHMSWMVQRLAVEAAYKIFVVQTKSRQPVDFYFDAFDQIGAKAAREAHAFGAKNFRSNMRVSAVASKLHQQSKRDPRWQVNKH